MYLYSNVSKEYRRRLTALDFHEAGIILHPLTAVADNPPVVHDNAGVSRRLIPVGCNDDIPGRGFTHGNLIESFVMGQGIPKNGRAENVFWRRSQHDSLFCCLCEDDRYGQRVFRGAREWTSKIPGGHSDALKRRLGYSRTIGASRLFLCGVRAGPLIAIGLAGWKERCHGAGIWRPCHRTIMGS